MSDFNVGYLTLQIHFLVKINWLDAFLSYTSPDTFNTNRSLLFFLMFVILGNK